MFYVTAGNNEPKLNSCRLVYFLTNFVPTILMPAYTASLLTYIYIQFHTLPFTDVQGFLKDGTYKLMVDYNAFEQIMVSVDPSVLPLSGTENVPDPL